ncbi:hypothetical protein KIL84_006392 [Mauremys mutica]|uniref:Uncharacterized protein n=1 Tax=Mauremys mutica TaxID=74926 RepID=A0A9D4AUH4_9SAUR|nr:hypothetical protein KIL84_006392 [Mauremys mutica]
MPGFPRQSSGSCCLGTSAWPVPRCQAAGLSLPVQHPTGSYDSSPGCLGPGWKGLSGPREAMPAGAGALCLPEAQGGSSRRCHCYGMGVGKEPTPPAVRFGPGRGMGVCVLWRGGIRHQTRSPVVGRVNSWRGRQKRAEAAGLRAPHPGQVAPQEPRAAPRLQHLPWLPQSRFPRPSWEGSPLLGCPHPAGAGRQRSPAPSQPECQGTCPLLTCPPAHNQHTWDSVQALASPIGPSNGKFSDSKPPTCLPQIYHCQATPHLPNTALTARPTPPHYRADRPPHASPIPRWRAAPHLPNTALTARPTPPQYRADRPPHTSPIPC